MAGQSMAREESTAIGRDKLLLLTGGSGKPLLVLHEELGYPGWLKWNEALSGKRTLITPLHPGFGRTPRADWIMNVRDLACFYARFLRERKLAPVDVLGFSLGGWIAAEMAANDPALFSKMVLVGPAGIRPEQGEIFDLFRVPALGYLRASVRDPDATAEFPALYGGGDTPEQYEAFEDARAETARLAWQPYMHNPSLPHLLEGAAQTRSLLVWGREDRIVPFSAAAIHQRSLNAKLAAFDQCGHRPEVERTDRFIKEVEEFLS